MAEPVTRANRASARRAASDSGRRSGVAGGVAPGAGVGRGGHPGGCRPPGVPQAVGGGDQPGEQGRPPLGRVPAREAERPLAVGPVREVALGVDASGTAQGIAPGRRRPHRQAALLGGRHPLLGRPGQELGLGTGVDGGGVGEQGRLGPRQGTGPQGLLDPGQGTEAPAGLEGAPGLAGRDPLQGGEQHRRGPVALHLPVARGGDPGGQQALGRAHQALQLGQGGIEGGGIGTEQGVGVEVGHEGSQQPGEGGHLRGQAGGGRRSGVIRRHGGQRCRRV